MGKRDVFALGIVVGAPGAWLWASRIEGYVAARTRGARTRAVEGLRAVEEGAGRVLDRGESSLHRDSPRRGLAAGGIARLRCAPQAHGTKVQYCGGHHPATIFWSPL